MIVNLIRHGKTEANEKRIICGILDSRLSENGKLELHNFKEKKLYSDKIQFCIISTLKRTEETKEILFPGIPFIKETLINEINFGTYEGGNPKDYENDALYMSWLLHGDETYAPPNGESFEQLDRRVMRDFPLIIMKALKSEYTEIAIIGHGAYLGEVSKIFFNDKRPHTERLFKNGRGIRFHVTSNDKGLSFDKLEYI